MNCCENWKLTFIYVTLILNIVDNQKVELLDKLMKTLENLSHEEFKKLQVFMGTTDIPRNRLRDPNDIAEVMVQRWDLSKCIKTMKDLLEKVNRNDLLGTFQNYGK